MLGGYGIATLFQSSNDGIKIKNLRKQVMQEFTRTQIRKQNQINAVQSLPKVTSDAAFVVGESIQQRIHSDALKSVALADIPVVPAVVPQTAEHSALVVPAVVPQTAEHSALYGDKLQRIVFLAGPHKTGSSTMVRI